MECQPVGSGHSVHFRSERMDWGTPWSFFNALNNEFHFDIDVCASRENAKVERYWTEEDDCLNIHWGKLRCFMNPPYGRSIFAFMAKAYAASLKGALVVCLVPARTDTNWWHLFAMKGEVRFIKGRLRFEGAKHSAPFPSAVVIFRPKDMES